MQPWRCATPATDASGAAGQFHAAIGPHEIRVATDGDHSVEQIGGSHLKKSAPKMIDAAALDNIDDPWSMAFITEGSTTIFITHQRLRL